MRSTRLTGSPSGTLQCPAFVDVDNDGDMDLVIGRYLGDLKHYCENTGSAAILLTREERVCSTRLTGSPMWELEAPAFVDVNDGDMDLVIGRYEGDLKYYYENTGSATLLTRERVCAQPV